MGKGFTQVQLHMWHKYKLAALTSDCLQVELELESCFCLWRKTRKVRENLPELGQEATMNLTSM